MGAYLRLNAGEAVKVGTLTLPGVVTDVRVQGDLNIDEQDLENTNLKSLAVLGFTTQRVTVGLVLTGASDADVSRQLRQIQAAFQVDRVKQAGAKLVPVRIVNRHTDARRIKVVVFESFASWDSAEHEVTCQLVFREYQSDVARLQERVEDEQRRREKDAKDKKAGKGSGSGAGGSGSGSGASGATGTPPGGGKGTAGGSDSTGKATGTGGTPAALSGFEAGSAAARALAVR